VPPEHERATPSVPRPNKPSEYLIVLQGTSVEKQWNDCVAAARSAMTDAWDVLTTAPTTSSPRQYRLRAAEANRMYQGRQLPQWEYKITDGGGFSRAPQAHGEGARQPQGSRPQVVEVEIAAPRHRCVPDEREGGEPCRSCLR